MRFSFSLLCAAVAALAPAAASAAEHLDKRQGYGINITGDGTGGTFSAGQPLICVEGCTPAMLNYAECDDVNTTRTGNGPNRPDGVFDPLYAPPCNWLCSETNYTGFTQCINCLISNGADVKTESLEVLAKANQFCEGRIGTTVTEITATPTTTAATETSFSESSLNLAVWTGLTSFLAAHETEIGQQAPSSTISSASASSEPAASSSGAAVSGMLLIDSNTALGGGVAAIMAILLC